MVQICKKKMCIPNFVVTSSAEGLITFGFAENYKFVTGNGAV